MARNLLTIDHAFTQQYRSLLEIQQSIVSQLASYPFDLSGTEITDAIVERMMAFWHFNVNNNKKILDRKVNTTAADFFTETCLLFFKSYFERRPDIKVCSEKNIAKGSIIRPDLSIWLNDRLIAAIELKVSNGWKGKNMAMHLEERECNIRQINPGCLFTVLSFWNFFDCKADTWNNKHFGLLCFNKNNSHERTDASVEKMMLLIEKHISSKPLSFVKEEIQLFRSATK